MRTERPINQTCPAQMCYLVTVDYTIPITHWRAAVYTRLPSLITILKIAEARQKCEGPDSGDNRRFSSTGACDVDPPLGTDRARSRCTTHLPIRVSGAR